MRRFLLIALFALVSLNLAWGTADLMPNPKFCVFNSSGVPLVGGKLYSYSAGTSTPLSTYTDSTGGSANANPTILDSTGCANVWLSAVAYKFTLNDSADVLVWTVDNVLSNLGANVAKLNAAETFTALQRFTFGDLEINHTSGGGGILLNSAGSDALTYTATFPANTGTVSELNATETFSGVKTLTNPRMAASSVIQNSTGAVSMGFTLKKGTGAGNYSSASTTYVRVDSTNLAYTVTIPTGWKLAVQASGSVGTLTAAVLGSVALADGSADNTGILVEQNNLGAGVGSQSPFSIGYVITGDGASHTINLQYKTSAGADSVFVSNSTATLLPVMVFTLMPSN